MLTENQLNALAERVYQRVNVVNTEYLISIGETLKKIGELRPSDVHKLQQMYDYGMRADNLVRELAKASEKNVAEIYDIFDIVAQENYDFATPFFKAKGIPHVPYAENKKLNDYVRSIAKQTADEYMNLTQHTAFAVFAKDGKSIAPLFAANKDKMATSLSDTYTRVVDYAVQKVQLGLTDYNSAIKEITKALADSGIKTVDYATGYSRRLDTSVRQNVLWGIKQCNQNVADLVGEEFGADGYEISYHSHPRPSHAEMGGRQYARGKARTVNGVHYPSFEEEAEPLLAEYNCLHFKFPILLGISRPAYSDAQLEHFKTEDKQTFEFEGRKYTKYEGTQLQRRMETAVRNHKDLANIAKAAGDDDLRREAQYKINLLTNKYAKLADASGLPTKMERMDVRGFRSVKIKSIDNVSRSGIIKDEELVKLYDKSGKYLRSIPRPDVKLPDETMSIITKGTHITDVEVFAGKGAKNELRVREHLKNNYGGNADNWQHSKGHAFVDTPNGSKKANVHWFEEESVGVVEMFVKGWSKK